MTWLPTAVLLAGVILFAWRGRRRLRALLATVRVETLPAVRARRLGNARPITVYLPPGYDARPERRYKVLYLNDGQDAAGLELRHALAALARDGAMAPIIAVAIPTSADRLREYGTAAAPNAAGYGDRAADYAHFVTAELVPRIDNRYRTQAAPAGRAILGASLGGLAAFDIAWNHPDVFGTAGVLSGSFWWRAGEDGLAPAAGRRIVHHMVRTSGGGRRPRLRLWLQAATRDEVADRDGNGVIDAIQDTRELMDELAAVGYKEGEDMVYVQVESGRHDVETWAKVVPEFLQWAFPVEKK